MPSAWTGLPNLRSSPGSGHWSILASRSRLNAEQIGVLIGTGVGGLKVKEDQQEVYLTRGPSRSSPFMIPMMIANMAAGLSLHSHRGQGSSSCVVTACAAGSNPSAMPFRLVQNGYAQVPMICGGTRSCGDALSLAGFAGSSCPLNPE